MQLTARRWRVASCTRMSIKTRMSGSDSAAQVRNPMVVCMQIAPEERKGGVMQDFRFDGGCGYIRRRGSSDSSGAA